MVIILLVGAFIFMRFLAISELPFLLADLITESGLPTYALFACIVVLYIILGMFLDIFSSIILTIPIIYPAILAMGFDPIWFGVILVVIMEMGLITPPVGLNVFALAGVTDIPLTSIFLGAIPFVAAMIVCVVILTVFPDIALLIPGMM
jgi:TRAP-type C4-dicarboxylate transport system permease large subunit